jgi:hypothetical protein
MDFDDCEHNYGTYTCFESGYERCKACGVVMNASKEEFYSDE